MSAENITGVDLKGSQKISQSPFQDGALLNSILAKGSYCAPGSLTKAAEDCGEYAKLPELLRK